MTDKYTISHISDIMKIPPEHYDELFKDLRDIMESTHALIELAQVLGDKQPLDKILPEVVFKPDGLSKSKIKIAGI